MRERERKREKERERERERERKRARTNATVWGGEKVYVRVCVREKRQAR